MTDRPGTARRAASWWRVLLVGAALSACSSNNPSDGGADVVTDALPPGDTGPRDTGPADAAVSRAGQACTAATDCGPGLMCDTDSFLGYGICSATCTESTSSAAESAMCGGLHSTCLTMGDPPQSVSLCLQSCSPNARSGVNACAAGFICTGGWVYTSSDTVDDTACMPFCSMDSQCSGGLRCNPRTGMCDSRGANPAGLRDGSQCDTNALTDPCRGLCFAILGAPGTLGLCGSYVDLSATSTCPDNPDTIPVEGTSGDNLGLCLFEDCADDCGCPAPLHCITGGQLVSGVCGWVDPSDPGEMTTPPASGSCGGADGGTDGGTATDGGTSSDGGFDGGNTDAGATDAASAG